MSEAKLFGAFGPILGEQMGVTQTAEEGEKGVSMLTGMKKTISERTTSIRL